MEIGVKGVLQELITGGGLVSKRQLVLNENGFLSADTSAVFSAQRLQMFLMCNQRRLEHQTDTECSPRPGKLLHHQYLISVSDAHARMRER